MELLNYKIYSESGTISFQKPVIVCIHGLGSGYANWVFQVRYLRNKYDLLLVELPSHGKSKVRMSDMELTFDSISKKIVEVLDHLGIQKANFAGVSLGTMIVQHLVLTYPEKVDKYILAGPVGRFNRLHEFAIRFALFLLPVAPLKLVLNFVCTIAMPYKCTKYARALFVACAQRVERKEFMALFKVVLTFSPVHDRFAQAMGEEPDGLYLIGELDHFFLPILKKDMKRIKNLAIIENAGHICNVDQYEKVNELMVRFIETGSIA